MKDRDISILVGKTLVEVIKSSDNSQITIKDIAGNEYIMYHSQDCCESVYVDDIEGDLDYLIGSIILMAEESTNSDVPKDDYDESFMWTFYRFQTAKGFVVIKWYGSSNGYYSESVSFSQI